MLTLNLTIEEGVISTSKHLCTDPHFWGSESPWPWRGCGDTRPCTDWAPSPGRQHCPSRAGAWPSYALWRPWSSSWQDIRSEMNEGYIMTFKYEKGIWNINHEVRIFTTFIRTYHNQNRCSTSILDHIQTFSHRLTRPLLEGLSVLSPHLGCVNIGWRLCVRLRLEKISKSIEILM